MTAGDVIVIPAGVGHRQLSRSEDFLVVGGDPAGSPRADLLCGAPGERPDADARIAVVPLPETDPVTGAAEPLVGLWRR